jgi:hypothetical protein
MRSYVYLLKDQGTVFYVGKGTGGRMYEHAKKARASKRNLPCLNKIRKMGRKGRRVGYDRVLFTDDAEEAYSREIALIAFYGPENLTNLTHGGEGARRLNTTVEHRQRIRNSIRERYRVGELVSLKERNPEAWEGVKRKLSLAMRRRVGPKRGKDRRPGASERRTAAQKASWAAGRRHSPQAIEKMREAGRRGGLARTRTVV